MNLGFAKPDCWSPSGSVCCWVLGLCECPSQSEVEVPHLWPLLHPRAESIQGPKALSRGTSWHLSDWDRVVCGGRSCGSAERPDRAVLYGLRAGSLHGPGSVFVREEAATRCLPCTLGLADALCAFFFLLFPLLTRLSLFCLQCLFLITPFMIWPGIRF